MSIRKKILNYLAKLYDLCALFASFVLAALIVYSSSKEMKLGRLLTMRITFGNCVLFALLLIFWHNLFVLCGLYISNRLKEWRREIIEIGKATALASGFLLFTAKVFHIATVNGAFVFVFFVSCTAFMIAGRQLARPLLMVLRKRGRNSRCLLIIGTNQRAIEFARHLTEHPELGYRIIGFVDDDWPGIKQFETSGHQRCCTFSGLADFLRHNVVDETAIYLPVRSYYEYSAQLASQCEQHGIVIRFDSRVFNVRGKQAPANNVDEYSHLVGLNDADDAGLRMVKRTIDFVLSATLLILLAFVFAVVAILIKLTSQGPVFFSQTRVGLNKRQFKMYKFRTMVMNAEQMQNQLLARNEMSGPVFKMKDDPRVTPLGKFLRKSSLDELPQLWNVVKGDMSLVGPRAMSFRDYALFDQDWQRRRFSVKPGITCLWQVNGRNSVPFEQWMELDMQYIDKWSLWLDFKILAQTVPAVLRGTGAA